jgi:hypothetical protein
MRRLLVLVTSLVLGCGPTSDDGGGGGGGGSVDSGPGGGTPDARQPDEFADATPVQKCDKMDILFVVDNSGSMGQEQDNLAANFPQFIEVLENFDSNLDYRVAITTTGRDYSYSTDTGFGPVLPGSQDGGDNGAMLQRCDMTRRWVEPGDPTPSTTFACAAQVGTSGPSKEMPLAVIKQAFSERMADNTNTGFRRDDALLGIVILTDEDDCSYEQSVTLGFSQSLCDDMMEPTATYKSFLDGYTGDAGRWAVAVIAGETDCSSDLGGAAEATRLKQFVTQVGANAVISSICDADLASALNDALDTFDTACNNFPPID